MTQIFETNQNVVNWLVKRFDLSWFESGCMGFDLKILADFICNLFFHLKSERHFKPEIYCNNVIVSAFALHYCQHWGPNAMTEALVIYIFLHALQQIFFLNYAWGRNKSDAWEALENCKLY